MEAKEKIELAEKNIRKALADYGKHVEDDEVLRDVSDSFVKELARDTYYAKEELRNLFRKSPVWNEELDALVINGTRTHDANYERVKELAYAILSDSPHYHEQRALYKGALAFFSNPDPDEETREWSIQCIKELAPKAYARNKKPSRIFKALCDAIGVSDEEKNSWFQRTFAKLADELQSKKIDFKLYVSVNPAHFLTMSNPKRDKRGNTLTSCHSFNSTEYEYNNGCTGYARDKYSFIVFTAADPNDPETLNNRKTTRQIFAYRPGNGVLLQSRMYNTSGGTYGAQSESKLYRDLVQREISMLEDAANLWETFTYIDNDRGIKFDAGEGFGGYLDWTYRDFNAKVSIRKDHTQDHKLFKIGTYGLCIKCADETSDGVYCEDCVPSNRIRCYDCDEYDYEENMYQVSNSHGDEVYVCRSCYEDHYDSCHECGDYWDEDSMTETQDETWVCPNCAERYYSRCYCCDELVRNDDTVRAVGSRGYFVDVCDRCISDSFVMCGSCGYYVDRSIAETVDIDGEKTRVCPECARLMKEVGIA